MTLKGRETIQRMLGQIEGVAFTLDNKSAQAIFEAVEIIDGILDKEKGGEKE